jgi:membrane protein implicated in regulation of membrane protease activity
MSPALAWAIVALVLVIAELVTGTFYLLMLGAAAFGAAAAAWLGYGFAVQSVVGAVLAGAGCYGVHLYRAQADTKRMPPLDLGMPASFEGWLDARSRRARVRYRGASWDAEVQGNDMLEPGSTLFVVAADGNTLKVATSRPG